MTFLHVQLAEAINLQDRSLSAQLHETVRSVRELPPHRYASSLHPFLFIITWLFKLNKVKAQWSSGLASIMLGGNLAMD